MFDWQYPLTSSLYPPNQPKRDIGVMFTVLRWSIIPFNIPLISFNYKVDSYCYIMSSPYQPNLLKLSFPTWPKSPPQSPGPRCSRQRVLLRGSPQQPRPLALPRDQRRPPAVSAATQEVSQLPPWEPPRAGYSWMAGWIRNEHMYHLGLFTGSPRYSPIFGTALSWNLGEWSFSYSHSDVIFQYSDFWKPPFLFSGNLFWEIHVPELITGVNIRDVSSSDSVKSWWLILD